MIAPISQNIMKTSHLKSVSFTISKLYCNEVVAI